MSLLSVRGLSRIHPGQSLPAIDGVDLDVEAGRTTAVIGESGSGKSTLARLMLGLERPSAGEILFDSQPVRPGSARQLRWLRRRTGLVFQDPYASLDPRHTVGRIIAEPLRGLRIPGDHRAMLLASLDRVGLDAWRADQHPHELSGGQRQRVALARAVVHGPELLIGDEPTSALDVTVRAQILRLLGELQEREGLTLVLITHDLGLVQQVADAVVVLHRGRVVEAGPASLLRAPTQEYTRGLAAAVPRLIGPDDLDLEEPAAERG